MSPDDLVTDYEGFENYQGVEENQHAIQAIQEYYEKGYLRKCDGLEEVKAAVGGNPVLSKLGCITKEKYNSETGKYVAKVRIILDCRRSGVSKAADRRHKVVLPRITDAVASALRLLSHSRQGEQVELFIADVRCLLVDPAPSTGAQVLHSDAGKLILCL